MLPVLFCILFPFTKFWYFFIRWFLFLTYSFFFDLFVMRAIVSKWTSLNTLLNFCDESFTLILYFCNLYLASFFAKIINFFWYSLVMRVAFCYLIGALILNNFGVTSFVNHFTKKINLFQANVPFLYPLKTSENRRFSDVFRGYKKGTLIWNGLISSLIQQLWSFCVIILLKL